MKRILLLSVLAVAAVGCSKPVDSSPETNINAKPGAVETAAPNGASAAAANGPAGVPAPSAAAPK